MKIFRYVLGLMAASAVNACGADEPKTNAKSSAIECGDLEFCIEAVAELNVAEDEMQVEFDAAIERLRNCAPENSTLCHDMPRAEELVVNEQAAWLAWRNAKCDTFWFGREYTSNHGEMLAVCRTEMTRKRMNYLSEIRAD